MQNLNNLCEERGQVLIELALVLPLILMVALGTAELSRTMRISQVTNVLSREAGSIAFRRCADFREPGGRAPTELRTLDCLRDVLGTAGNDGLQSFADSLEAGGALTIVISVYRYDDQPGTLGLWKVGTEGETGGRTSRFSAGGTAILLDSVEAVPAAEVIARERIVVSEVFYRYVPVLDYIPGMSQLSAFDYYESTIF